MKVINFIILICCFKSAFLSEYCKYRGGILTPVNVNFKDPAFLKCPLDNYKKSIFFKKNITSYDITWFQTNSLSFVRNYNDYKNFKKIEVNNENASRVQLIGNNLWLYPVINIDDGIYICRFRSHNICEEMSIKLTFLDKEETITYRFNEGLNSTVHCMDIDLISSYFKNKTLDWYKNNNKVLYDDRIQSNKLKLVIKNTTHDDSGIYTCNLRINKDSINYDIKRNYNVVVL
ncbi:interleukin-1 receptor-like protein [Lumpy skin disease virus]|uniref:Interleukin-1 receptor-like protein n=1 Tax=Lumpy skin disease virus TaxID=59509 RepID=A0A1W6S9H4_LSDV|nr:interleukin-1 receptor-like protein [Lumpy skin disease virus]ART89330.1 interleukin-1 receptor-like protein [Lumpy skin disease virus]ATG80191.1 interleukin-1 receptor-like protein [Lumpy skin disease virus]AZC86006.1 interleukin-1 receptor-like protein [Lumpy skin disease virus]QGM12458.1 interleukin-1 receptor-like protein [Lumpy skin disease virus]